MAKHFLYLFFFLLGACGSGTSQFVSSIEFSPNPAQVSGTTCTSTGQLVSLSSETVTLTTLTAQFSDISGNKVKIVLNAEEIDTAAGILIIPPYGVLSIPLTFDLATLSLPADGTVVILGSQLSGIAEFVGQLRCEV